MTTNILQSKSFWTAVLDIVVSLVTYFGGKYGGASVQDMQFVIGVLQPMWVILIAHFTVSDITAMKEATKVTMAAMQYGGLSKTYSK